MLGSKCSILWKEFPKGDEWSKEMGLRVDEDANWREQSILKLAMYLCYKSKGRQ